MIRSLVRPFLPLVVATTAAVSMWELLMRFVGSRVDIPALIIGVGLMLVAFAWSLENREQERQARLIASMTAVDDHVGRLVAPSSDVTNVYRFRAEADDVYNDQLARAARRADILDISLFRALVAGRNRTRWEEALSRGARFRVLLLDPASPSLSSVAESVGAGVGSLRQEIAESLSQCRRLSERFPNFEFRLYRDPQPFQVYLLEDFAFLIPRLTFRTQAGLALQVRRGPIFRDIEDMFDSIWNMSATPLAYQAATS